MRKLVRDKIPRIMMDDGHDPEVRILSSAELDKALRTKLVEEANEVVKAENSYELLGELADVMEVVYSIRKQYNWSMGDIQERIREKNGEKGSFSQGFEVETSPVPTPLFGVGLDRDGNDAILLPNRAAGKGYVTSDPATRNVGLVTHVRFYSAGGKKITVPMQFAPIVAPGDVLHAKFELS